MKNKKLKSINYQNEDTKEIKTLIIIVLIIIAVALGLYFITEKALDKKNAPAELPEAVISYTETIIGEMFNKPENEYYVLAYSSEDDNAAQYETLLSNYNKKEKALTTYHIDLSKKFNSTALSDKSNPKPTKATDVAIKDVALILIKDGKVTKYYETIETIEKALS